MKKSKKIITALLCAVMVLQSSLPVYAKQADANQLRGPVLRCPECLGVVDVYTTEKFDEEILKWCEHVPEGLLPPGMDPDAKDHYDKYIVTNKEKCRSCSYNNIFSYDKYVYLYCDMGLS